MGLTLMGYFATIDYMEQQYINRKPNVKCYYCGRPFYKPLTYLKRNPKHHFCSVECRGLWNYGKPCHTEKFKRELAERNRKRIKRYLLLL